MQPVRIWSGLAVSAALLTGCGVPLERTGPPATNAAALAAADETVEGTAAGDTLETRDAAPPRRPGIMARLFNSDDRTRTPVAADAVETAALGRVAAAPSQVRGQYGRGTAQGSVRRADDVSQDVPYGALMPFGSVGRVCDARSRNKGRKIDRSDAGYTLHDSAPRSTGPRTFYITGFADGCPRQFTAALAMFGAPAMHEQLRYGRPSDDYPYSATDRAYEQVKSAICGVGRRKPCGNRIRALERNTVFISTYERFTNNGRWADILVHDGAVLAASLKDP